MLDFMKVRDFCRKSENHVFQFQTEENDQTTCVHQLDLANIYFSGKLISISVRVTNLVYNNKEGVYLSISLSLYLFIYLFIYLSVGLSVCT